MVQCSTSATKNIVSLVVDAVVVVSRAQNPLMAPKISIFYIVIFHLSLFKYQTQKKNTLFLT